MSIAAVGFVTWMIFWMRRQARFFKGELQGKLDTAIAGGTAALALMAFVAVGREGLETAVFVWSAVSAAGSGAGPVTGAVLGLVTATVIGFLLYKGSVRINLATFFTFTGESAQPLPENAGCLACHRQNAATDHVFTQYWQ